MRSKDELDFSGKTLLVTGSGRNIGKAIILEFASRGANVIVNSRSNEEEANAAAAEAETLGARALVVMGNAADRSVVEAMKREADRAFGGVDMYVSNAARRLSKGFFDLTDEEWFRYLNQQLTASWYLARTFAPDMQAKKWGRIIHINGSDGWRGGWMRVPHSVGKGGLRTLTKSLAAGLGQYGITVNDVNPGFTGTVRDPATHPGMTEERKSQLREQIPIRRETSMEELAWVCALLCSPRSAALTGGVIHADGGWNMLG
ncbi:SDR family oxidoreductase [Streptomyces sp. SID8361]|uniref:SDR family NAD(P)-dependent oxidoreductase n=1 Tax=Streptomyces sp. MnatMP-M27 TaxID=1839768 RepID=UPI00081E2D02|nr:SDR family oxidoreductase [Streptomyces sp. MnatMP-M27]MYU11185.1 SDR family oxidoreductase [Streptomyces sp. SID8361]SCF78980.1 3-oxoacyl-[acyl-carrier protein] reductase [Streptomyces sp. MnatMP-M27]